MKKTLSLLILSSCVLAHADIKVTATDTSGTTVMFMNQEFVRINLDEVNQSLVYEAQADTFRHLNHRGRSYMEVDQQTVKELGEAMNAAISEMKNALANLPKAQQEAMAGLLGTPPEGEPATLEQVVSKTGNTQTLQGVPCEEYAVTLDGELVSEVWAASYKSLKISESDVQGFRKLSAFQEKMMESFKTNPLAKKRMKAGVTMFSEIDGFPLLVKSYDDGEVENEFKVDSIVNVDRNEDLYVIPSDYRKQEVPGLGGQ